MSTTAVPDNELTFGDLQIPTRIGIATYIPTEASTKKFAYALEDESGWVSGSEGDRRVHPAVMANYLWWPQGFYFEEPTGSGHFNELWRRFPNLIALPFLHTRTTATFYRAPRVGEPVHAVADVVEKYERRDKEYIVIKGAYQDPRGVPLADYTHTCMIRSRAPLGDDRKAKAAQSSSGKAEEVSRAPAKAPDLGGKPVKPFDVTLTLANARLYSLPLESFHTHDSLAKKFGFPRAVPQGLMSYGWLIKLCTEYFGPEWVNTSGHIEVAFINMLFRDDVMTVGGHVVEVENVSDSQVKVKLQIHVDDQNGRRVAAGEATGVLKRSEFEGR
ncbi:hypothetical protein JQ594_00390 [Bradyrhizobium manausense]|uniref:MaoC family dehydratase n=1 Tax=Bradyrhizobium manausense TaxID=989370 RepID=UPI001BA5A4AC|nr:MaoC family dehydratase [Bradyrhizobium manausense]MBR0684362.1 hypothetical protein [Bradyrhizobium manausense]